MQAKSVVHGKGVLSSLLIGLFVSTWYSEKCGAEAVSWEKMIDVPVYDRDATIAYFEDGSYVVGNTWEEEVTHDMYGLVTKFDVTDDVEWRYTLSNSGKERIKALTIANDSQIALLGETYLDGAPHLMLVELNGGGNVTWSKSFNSSDLLYGNAITAIPKGGYIVTGAIDNSTTGKNVFVMHVNASGDEQWTTAFVDGYGDESGTALTVTAQRIFVMGTTASYGGVDLFVISLSDTGVIENSYLFAQDGNAYGQGIAAGSDANVFLTGYTDSLGDWDMFTAQLDHNATLQSWKVVDGEGEEKGYGIVRVNDDAYLVVGTAYYNESNHSDILISQLSRYADIEWIKRWDENEYVQGYNIASDGKNITAVGTIHDNGTYRNLFILKTPFSAFEDCGMLETPEIVDLTQNITQTALTFVPFSPILSSYDLVLQKEEVAFSESVLCSWTDDHTTTSTSPTASPTRRPTSTKSSENRNDFARDTDNMVARTIYILLGFIVYALAVPIFNTIWNHLKEKRIERWNNMHTVIGSNFVIQGHMTVYTGKNDKTHA